MRPDGQLPCQPWSLLGDPCAAPLGALRDKAGRVIVPWLVHDGPLVRSGCTLEAGELLTIAARLSLGLDGVPNTVWVRTSTPTVRLSSRGHVFPVLHRQLGAGRSDTADRSRRANHFPCADPPIGMRGDGGG